MDLSRINAKLGNVLVGHSIDLFLLVEKISNSQLMVVVETLVETVIACARFGLAISIIWTVLWFRVFMAVITRVKFISRLWAQIRNKLRNQYWLVLDTLVPSKVMSHVPTGALRVKSGDHLRDLLEILDSDEDTYAGCSVLMDCSKLGSLADTVRGVKEAVRVGPSVVWYFHCDPDRIDFFKTLAVLTAFAVLRAKSVACEIVFHAAQRTPEPLKALEGVFKSDAKLRRRMSDPCLLSKSTKVVGTDTPNLSLTRKECFGM